MADRTVHGGPERRRIKTLAQAALNADVTVGQLEGVMTGLGDTLNELNSTMSPVSATEHALRGVLNAVRNRTAR